MLVLIYIHKEIQLIGVGTYVVLACVRVNSSSFVMET